MENTVGKYIDVKCLSWHQIMELDACTRCGECLKWCPVYTQDSNKVITPREKLKVFRRIIAAQNSLIRKVLDPGSWLGRIVCPRLPTEEEISLAVKAIFECSTCRQCHFVCPSRIDTVELYESLRRALMDSGISPLPSHVSMIASCKAYDNPWSQPRSQRARWTRIAKKENRITNIPTLIKPPKNLSHPG